MRYIKGRRPGQQAQTKIHRLHIDEKSFKKDIYQLRDCRQTTHMAEVYCTSLYNTESRQKFMKDQSDF